MKPNEGSFASLVGQYRLEAPTMVTAQTGQILTITAIGERLFGEAKDQKAELLPEGEDQFQAEGLPIKLTFIRGVDGRASELKLSFMGLSQFVARRID